VIEPLANITGRATEQTVLTCKINRGKPDADIKWCAFTVDIFYVLICIISINATSAVVAEEYGTILACRNIYFLKIQNLGLKLFTVGRLGTKWRI